MRYEKLKELLILTCEEVRYSLKANEQNEPGRAGMIREITGILVLELPREIIEKVKLLKNPLDDYEEVAKELKETTGV